MSRSPLRGGRPLLVLLAPVLLWIVGCHSLNLLSHDRDERVEAVEKKPGGLALPSKYSFRIHPYVFVSDFEIQRTQPLFQELGALREQVYKQLLLPSGSTLVQVYLFETRERYQEYMEQNYKGLPQRRAYFVADPRNGDLLVYTYWNERIRQDLRHELTHALLHTVIRDVPLWLDEGLAEYFELTPEKRGVNASHVELLRRAFNGPYRPDLARLEGLKQVKDMNPPEYREAWAWVHLMLHSKPEARTALLSYLQQLRGHRPPGPLKEQLARVFPSPEDALVAHVNGLPGSFAEERAEAEAPGLEPARR
jgi:hypothetical protein